MIEKQSDNVENVEENVSEVVNANEDSSVIDDQIKEDEELLDEISGNINTEDLKNTISNNDAKLQK